MKKQFKFIGRHLVLLLLAVIWLIPIVWLVVTSFSGYKGINTAHFFPQTWSLDNYVALFLRPDSVVQYKKWFANTLVIAIFTALISTIFVLMVAYTMSCMRFKGRKQLMSFGIILNMFPGVLSMIAVYFILKSFGLTNSHVGMIIVYSAGSGLGYLIAKGFMDTISNSLREAARLEGASEAKIFWKIILPLSKPVLATIALFLAVGYWNNYFAAQLYCALDRDVWPVAMVLKQIMSEASTAILEAAQDPAAAALASKLGSKTIQYAAVVVTTVPIMCVYPFLQKYFAKGVMVGGVKG